MATRIHSRTPEQHHFRATVLALILLLSTSLLAVFIVVLYSVEQVNEEARLSSENYIAATLAEHQAQLATLSKDYAYWDDTIQHAYRSPDKQWIDANIGQYLFETFGISDLYLIEGTHRTLLKITAGVVTIKPADSAPAMDVIDLVSDARRSGPIPEQVSGILMIDGTPALAGASVLTPEVGTAALPAPRPVLILAKRLNPARLQTIARQYQLDRLTLYNALSSDFEGASVLLKGPRGSPLARLGWQPGAPGDLVLLQIGKPLVLLLVIGLFAYLIIRTTRSAARKLERANSYSRLITAAVNQSRSAVLVFNIDGDIVYANSGMRLLLGLCTNDDIGEKIADVFPTELNPGLYRALQTTIRSAESWSGEFEYRAPDGNSCWVHATLSPVSDQQTEPHFSCVIDDITPMKEAYDDMAHLASHDVLTGLLNRRLFNEMLEQAISAASRDRQSSALLFIDLDEFKKVNDDYGHKAGDTLLSGVARRLQACVREADIVARTGGDEFSILLRNTSDHDDISTICDKILSAVTQPITLSDTEIHISASIGVALIPQDGLDADTLLTRADVALYRSKELGRNQFRFCSQAAEKKRSEPDCSGRK